ncbi:hypothetical protein Q3G72_007517 [Acer saccharum]|nr:hypothetical protein Q3G72_007517 [Acer saccharum]
MWVGLIYQNLQQDLDFELIDVDEFSVDVGGFDARIRIYVNVYWGSTYGRCGSGRICARPEATWLNLSYEGMSSAPEPARKVSLPNERRSSPQEPARKVIR